MAPMTIVNKNTFSEFAGYIEKFPKLAVDTETTGVRMHTKDVVCGVAIYDGTKSWYLPIRHSLDTNITPDQYKDLLKILSKLQQFVNHHTVFDLIGLTKDGLDFHGSVVDTMPGAQLLDENDLLGLKHLADRYLGANSSSQEKELNATLGKWGLPKQDMWKLPPEIAAPYAEQDTVLAWNLADYISSHLPSELFDIWMELNDFSELLRRMETRGLLIDVERMHQRKTEALRAATTIQNKVSGILGRPINLNAPAQVARLFALSKADEASLQLVKHLPMVDDVLKYRWYMKAVNTYYNKYPDFMDGNHVLHCHFKLTGTETGRISCAEPNLTAVPRWSEEQKVKDVFVARPGYTFVEADYSQAEIRVAAHYTQDKAVLEIFDKDLDYHGETARKLGIERQKAKVLNLAINYGAGINSLVEQLGWSEKAVKKVLQDYHAAFPGFRKTSKEVEKLAEERGWIRYWTGRRRHFNSRFSESRKAFNSLVQGGTAGMVQRTMQRLDKELPEFIQLLQVHDSVKGEVLDELVPTVIKKLKYIMEDQPWCKIRMKVDIKAGKRWSEEKEVHV